MCIKISFMALISNKEFYKKDKKELVKHFSKNEETLIITGYDSGLNFDDYDKNLKFYRLQNENDLYIKLNQTSDQYDCIILVDIIEVSMDINNVLNLLKNI